MVISNVALRKNLDCLSQFTQTLIKVFLGYFKTIQIKQEYMYVRFKLNVDIKQKQRLVNCVWENPFEIAINVAVATDLPASIYAIEKLKKFNYLINFTQRHRKSIIIGFARIINNLIVLSYQPVNPNSSDSQNEQNNY